MGTVRLKCWMSSRGPNSVPEARPRPQFTLTNACRGCWRSLRLLLAGGARISCSQGLAPTTVPSPTVACLQTARNAGSSQTPLTLSSQLTRNPGSSSRRRQIRRRTSRRSPIGGRPSLIGKRERESLVHMGRVILADHNLVKWRAKFSFHIFFYKRRITLICRGVCYLTINILDYKNREICL
jgi:hypothetical protein